MSASGLSELIVVCGRAIATGSFADGQDRLCGVERTSKSAASLDESTTAAGKQCCSMMPVWYESRPASSL